jgi:hypothetical protein
MGRLVTIQETRPRSTFRLLVGLPDVDVEGATGLLH